MVSGRGPIGIWIKYTSAAGFQSAYPAVIATAIVGIAAFVLAGRLVAVRRRAVNRADQV